MAGPGLPEVAVSKLKPWAVMAMLSMPKPTADPNSFIAVGALHLAGPRGLIALLRQRGYRVTPVQ